MKRFLKAIHIILFPEFDSSVGVKLPKKMTKTRTQTSAVRDGLIIKNYKLTDEKNNVTTVTKIYREKKNADGQ